ncbi:MAG: RNA polymerase sigma factor [Candidatus Nomurabacteria bacterium]|nr:RNA polymerase sigma factor [Candidatus Nomurabacteria bacterium]
MDPKEEKRRNQFIELYDTHADAIFRFCYFKTGNRETAKDLTQDIFIKVFNYLEKEEIQNQKSFIYTIAKNIVIDFWRKNKSIPESHLPEGLFESITAEDNAEVSDNYAIFLSLLDKLSESDREVILLRYVEDMSSKDMADLLNERENTVLVRISRAREKLRDLFNNIENKNG